MCCCFADLRSLHFDRSATPPGHECKGLGAMCEPSGNRLMLTVTPTVMPMLTVAAASVYGLRRRRLNRKSVLAAG